MMRKSFQYGIGLLELMLALAVIAVILVMSTRYYNVAHRQQQVNATVKEIRAIVTASTEWAKTQYNYSGISFTILIANQYLPSNFSKTNVWQGAITIVPGKDTSQFIVQYTNIPTDLCNSLASKMSTQAVSSTCSGKTFTATF